MVHIIKFAFEKVENIIGVLVTLFLPFPKQQILDSSKLKEFADDNFKFD